MITKGRLSYSLARMIFQIHQEIKHSTASPNSLSEFCHLIQAAGTSFHSLEANREPARFHCKASGGSRSGSPQTPTYAVESHSDQRDRVRRQVENNFGRSHRIISIML